MSYWQRLDDLEKKWRERGDELGKLRKENMQLKKELIDFQMIVISLTQKTKVRFDGIDSRIESLRAEIQEGSVALEPWIPTVESRKERRTPEGTERNTPVDRGEGEHASVVSF